MLHGYVYLNLSNLRVFGARMPGASPELMDRTYLGERSEAPAYDPHPDDDKPEYTERILATVDKVFATENRDDFAVDAAAAERVRRGPTRLQPLSDAELVELQGPRAARSTGARSTSTCDGLRVVPGDRSARSGAGALRATRRSHPV